MAVPRNSEILFAEAFNHGFDALHRLLVVGEVLVYLVRAWLHFRYGID
jgi:hypothetical protein